MIKRLLILLALLAAAGVWLEAQQRAIAAKTLQTTDTTANSLLIGCSVGSTSCSGGIKAGPAVFTGAVSGAAATFSGVFTDTAIGSHMFTGTGTGAQLLQVENTSAGTGNYAGLFVKNNSAYTGQFLAYSSNYTTSGPARANSVELQSDASMSGGLSIAARHTSGSIRFYTGGTTERWGINAAGDRTIGTAENISDSSGTPAITSSFGTSPSIRGTDYAFQVTNGSPPNNGTVTFGHTWSTIPICVVNASTSAGLASAQTVGSLASTTTLIISFSGAADAGGKINVLCRSY